MFFNDDTIRDDIDININNENVNTNMNDNMNMNTNMMNMGGNYNMPVQQANVMAPIIEPGRERVVNRTFVHEVPQYIPLLNNNIS